MSTTDPHPDEIAAAAAAQADGPEVNTRQWLLQASVATLCTISVHREVAGMPFGSVVPFALDATGRPYILIARIAAHTANLRDHPEGSLLVRQPQMAGDPQSGWRVTLMGEWETVPRDGPEWPVLHARYRARVPAAEGYLGTHGFDYWRMQSVRKVRYIAGFGKICWLPGAVLERDPAGAGVGAASGGAIAHMNEDHAANMQEMCRGLYGIEPERCEMTALERDGFFVRTHGPDGLWFFPFHKEIEARQIRGEVVRVLERAREATEKA